MMYSTKRGPNVPVLARERHGKEATEWNGTELIIWLHCSQIALPSVGNVVEFLAQRSDSPGRLGPTLCPALCKLILFLPQATNRMRGQETEWVGCVGFGLEKG